MTGPYAQLPPSLTEAELQAQLLEDIRDQQGIVAPSIPRLWRMYAPWSVYNTVVGGLYDLQYLRVKIHCFTILMSEYKRVITYAEPDRRQQLHELFENAESMYKDTLAEFTTAWAKVNEADASGAVVEQTVVGLHPIDLIGCRPSPDDLAYQGVPMVPSRKEVWP